MKNVNKEQSIPGLSILQPVEDNSHIKYHEPLSKEFETLSHDELRKQLSSFIKNLLVNNPEKLAAMMYRHDVKEHLFQNALVLEDIEIQTLAIADLVIEREMQKVESRKVYKKTRLK